MLSCAFSCWPCSAAERDGLVTPSQSKDQSRCQIMAARDADASVCMCARQTQRERETDSKSLWPKPHSISNSVLRTRHSRQGDTHCPLKQAFSAHLTHSRSITFQWSDIHLIWQPSVLFFLSLSLLVPDDLFLCCLCLQLLDAIAILELYFRQQLQNDKRVLVLTPRGRYRSTHAFAVSSFCF